MNAATPYTRIVRGSPGNSARRRSSTPFPPWSRRLEYETVMEARLPRCRFVRFIVVLALALAASACAIAAPVVLVVGDSISAGYGLPPETGWTTLLQHRLAAG